MAAIIILALVIIVVKGKLDYIRLLLKYSFLKLLFLVGVVAIILMITGRLSF